MAIACQVRHTEGQNKGNVHGNEQNKQRRNDKDVDSRGLSDGDTVSAKGKPVCFV